VKQKDRVWKFLQANAHFIRSVWFSFLFGVGTEFFVHKAAVAAE